MKTLVKSQVKPTIAISYKQSYKKKLQTFKFSFKSTKMLFNFGNIILFASLLFFLIVPESPELHSDLCNKYNSPQACNVW
tara:strand:+ start:353 stop:592 length:240 start_codon:yes stop_codon:yes gene_type:complete